MAPVVLAMKTRIFWKGASKPPTLPMGVMQNRRPNLYRIERLKECEKFVSSADSLRICRCGSLNSPSRIYYLNSKGGVDEVKRRMESGEDFTFIDVRNPASLGGIGYDAAESDPTAARQARRKPADTSEVQTHSCVLHLDEGSSASLAQKLQKLGHKDVWALQRGFRVWQNAGLPFREAA